MHITRNAHGDIYERAAETAQCGVSLSHILMIAPAAPPKNSPEAMQVRRYLEKLEAENVTLITTPIERGWEFGDDSLQLESTRLVTHVVSLPLPAIATRLLKSTRFKALHVPDNEAWLPAMAGSVLRRLRNRPDVIYTRSFPLSAALLGRKLKARLGVPWVMHLSDPWADNPYTAKRGLLRRIDERQEAACFNAADAVTLTTDRFRDFYAEKYPAFASKMAVTPNVMPEPQSLGNRVDRPEPPESIHIVHTGAFYGHRRPTPLLTAYLRLAQTVPDRAARLRVWFVGNMAPDVAAEIRACPVFDAQITGPLTYAETRLLQERADALLSIEPADDDPLVKGVLLSKMVDYLATRRPILAITPRGSVTAELCARGYGWAVDPRDTDALAHLLGEIAATPAGEKLICMPAELPTEFTADSAVARLEAVFRAVTDKVH